MPKKLDFFILILLISLIKQLWPTLLYVRTGTYQKANRHPNRLITIEGNSSKPSESVL